MGIISYDNDYRNIASFREKKKLDTYKSNQGCIKR